MRDAFFILLVILVLSALTAFRYRRQLAMAVQVSKALKNAASGSKQQGNVLNQKQQSELLAKCANCGTWVPQSRALKFSSGTTYCSTQCVETAMSVR